MSIRGPLLLPRDALLIPAGDLAQDVRERLDLRDDQFALTRPNVRSASKVLDADAARLLAEFREASSVVDAVLRFAGSEGREPREVLREAYPLLHNLVRAKFLVAPDTEEAERIGPSLAVGEVFEGLTVLRVVQTLDDTEVFQVRGPGGEHLALKLARSDDRRVRRAYEREAAVLEHLDGTHAPRLAALAGPDARPSLAAEWRSGVDPLAAASEARQRGDRRGALQVAAAVAEAYAALHERGVVHGDVHARNAIVDHAGSVTLVDFGLARWEGLPSQLANPERGGVAWFAAPEYAAERGSGRAGPADESSEQYSVCALLYTIVTGERYLDFSLEKEVLYRQILEQEPLPFVRRGVEPWPEVESILAVGLSKERDERFATMRELADRLRAVADAAPRSPAPRPDRLPDGPRAVLERVLARVAPAGDLWPPGEWEGPTASVNYGAAGIGYALYRLAVLRGDPALLADADVWVARARRDAEAGERPFYDDTFGVPREVAAGASPYHAPAGVACVEALVAQAMGDLTSHVRAVLDFVAASSARPDNLDLTLGRSGTLLGAALLLESATWRDERAITPLVGLVRETLAEVWDEIGSYSGLSTARELSYLGIAHGWGGVLYATLRACRAAQLPLPEGFTGRLDELADAAEPHRRGLRWRRKLAGHSGADYMPGWCNGSAGLVSLWLLAARHTGDARHLALAEGAGWNAWEDGDRMATLCCGFAGRAYAQLALYRHTGEAEWLARAAELADRAATGHATASGIGRTSLYKGDVAVAVLAADLEHPARSCFPLFEDEGWPAPALA